ncbi:MAG: type II/IV secretion system protein [Candidatus Hydrogenedentes bacterium]|nr:type II/IV secretion system protein [Candidatus Hydrogenedentota bacterium]
MAAKLRIIRNPADGPSGDDAGGPGIVPLHRLEEELINRLDTAAEQGAIAAVDAALLHAVHYRASDVHLEPWDDCLALRYRIDGILHDIARIPRPHQARVIARIKILARIVVYQRDVPQDGRIEQEATPCRVPMRASTFPTVNGEKIVIRIPTAHDEMLALDALGFRPGVADALRRFCRRPQGTLLLTGPSSSGKTTTIYALLHEIMAGRDSAPHVVTIEDPVERRLPQVAQTEINPHAGFTFEAALRSLLRQDPEVIMVGEIRDVDTARTAIQAGLTGHLVISTIHSGTAAGVFTRLIDMGVEPFLVASSITGVLAQRLVRTTCPACAAPDTPDPDLCAQFGVVDGPHRFQRGAGCDACQGIGYLGRTALGELLSVNEEIAELILTRPRTSALHEAALRNHMTPLVEDGLERALDGTTTLEELNRVVPRAAWQEGASS